nr:MAG TPA: hypothetical protein [Caudoviricetes sp.]
MPRFRQLSSIPYPTAASNRSLAATCTVSARCICCRSRT